MNHTSTDRPADTTPAAPPDGGGSAMREGCELGDAIKHAVIGAVSQVMNQQAPQCPPLTWQPYSSRDGGGLDWDWRVTAIVSTYTYPEVATRVAAVLAWAQALDLTHDPDAMSWGTRYSGTVHGTHVRVWTTTDEAARDAYFAQYSS